MSIFEKNQALATLFEQHKARLCEEEGLTEEEIIERDRLRQEYLAAFRQNLRAQLDNTYLVDDHGNKRPLKPKHTKKH